MKLSNKVAISSLVISAVLTTSLIGSVKPASASEGPVVAFWWSSWLKNAAEKVKEYKEAKYNSSNKGVPEPLTVLGTLTALGAGAMIRKEYLERQSQES
jgi:hypothetical protein